MFRQAAFHFVFLSFCFSGLVKDCDCGEHTAVCTEKERLSAVQLILCREIGLSYNCSYSEYHAFMVRVQLLS